ESDLDYSFVKAAKVVSSEGLTLKRNLINTGIVKVFPRERELEKVTFADVELGGKYVQGFVDDGLLLDGLTVAGVPSAGGLDDNHLNGHYNAKDGLTFGDTPITSSLAGEMVVFDYDDITGQNAMTLEMSFGDLVVAGRINYTNTKTYSDNGSTVVATR